MPNSFTQRMRTRTAFRPFSRRTLTCASGGSDTSVPTISVFAARASIGAPITIARASVVEKASRIPCLRACLLCCQRHDAERELRGGRGVRVEELNRHGDLVRRRLPVEHRVLDARAAADVHDDREVDLLDV